MTKAERRRRRKRALQPSPDHRRDRHLLPFAAQRARPPVAHHGAPGRRRGGGADRHARGRDRRVRRAPSPLDPEQAQRPPRWACHPSRTAAAARWRHDSLSGACGSAACAGERPQQATSARTGRRLAGGARTDAEAYVARHGPPHGLVPSALRIKAQKRLWGSCTAKGAINLNWRLILAPPPVFEYVVVHELCHLRVRNHQAPFWRLVGEVLPGFEQPRRWLKDNGHLLTLKPDELD
jgi:hypothetical protein